MSMAIVDSRKKILDAPKEILGSRKKSVSSRGRAKPTTFCWPRFSSSWLYSPTRTSGGDFLCSLASPACSSRAWRP